MEKYYNVHIYLFKGGEKLKTFSLAFKNRLIAGDWLKIDNIISGEMAYYKNQCQMKDESVFELRKKSIKELKLKGISLDNSVQVTRVFIHPRVNFSCVDYTAEVSVIL
jgi:hypothetical protein